MIDERAPESAQAILGGYRLEVGGFLFGRSLITLLRLLTAELYELYCEATPVLVVTGKDRIRRNARAIFNPHCFAFWCGRFDRSVCFPGANACSRRNHHSKCYPRA